MNPLDEVLTISEAAKEWDKDTSTLRWAKKRGRFKPDEYRETDCCTLILRSAMIRLYGPKEEKNENG